MSVIGWRSSRAGRSTMEVRYSMNLERKHDLGRSVSCTLTDDCTHLSVEFDDPDSAPTTHGIYIGHGRASTVLYLVKWVCPAQHSTRANQLQHSVNLLSSELTVCDDLRRALYRNALSMQSSVPCTLLQTSPAVQAITVQELVKYCRWQRSMFPFAQYCTILPIYGNCANFT